MEEAVSEVDAGDPDAWDESKLLLLLPVVTVHWRLDAPLLLADDEKDDLAIDDDADADDGDEDAGWSPDDTDGDEDGDDMIIFWPHVILPPQSTPDSLLSGFIW